MSDHRERREHWYHHDFIPWEQGRSFVDEPWDPSQANLRPEVRSALVVNLLTEDNLPYYFATFGRHFDEDHPMTAWSGLWTAEEGQHALAMRAYLLTSRNCDPKALEDERMQVVETGWSGDFANMAEMFCYTSAQELATRISHRNAGALSDDETAHALMSRIARDENHHFIFYRGVAKAMFDENPDMMMVSLLRVLQNFQMPGTGIPGFQRRALGMARLGVYNLRIHAEHVVAPLLKFWKLDEISVTSDEAQQAQEQLMAFVPDLIERAEVFERRQERLTKVKQPAGV